MDDATKKLITERYQVLPVKLQELLLKPALLSSIRLIAEKHHLPSDKASMLENEVILTLLAFEAVDGFDERIMAELLIPGSLALSIERDLKEMVFGEVEGELEALIQEQEHLGSMKAKEISATDEPRSVVSTSHASSTLPTPAPAALPPKPVADVPRYVKDDPYRESPK